MRFKLVIPLLLPLLAPLCAAAEVGFVEPWGKESELCRPPVAQPAPPFSLPTWLAEQVIFFHQRVLSPTDGPRSHFRPSSSNYMLQAIRRYGLWKGYIMGCDRLLRENEDPWVYRTIESEGKIFKWDPPE